MLTILFEALFPVLGVILLFGGTVLVHELGHFLTAKWFGLRIDAFSIGMGPAIWQTERNGVVYKISWLPIGGYVALPQLDITGSAFENEDAKEGRLEPVAPWKRIIIALAGPVMNIIAAFIIACFIWTVGRQADPGTQPAVIGYVDESSPAFEAGLREGDRIRKINGDSVTFWADVRITSMLNDRVDLKIFRDGELSYLYNIPTEPDSRGYLTLGGVGPEMPEMLGIKAGSVGKNTPAQKAGIEPGDNLLNVNGQDIQTMEQFQNAVQSSEGKPIQLTLQDAETEETRTVTLTAEWKTLEEFEDKGRWLIGISMMPVFAETHMPPLRQLNYFQGSIFRTLKAFLRPKERGKAAQGIGGPVLILSGMYLQVKHTLVEGLWFTALINVNLAIINLLPLIILDGGHIMVALFEWVTGKKPHRGFIIGLANVMVVILLLLMVVLSVRDVYQLRSWFAEEDNTEASPTPAATEPAAPSPPPSP